MDNTLFFLFLEHYSLLFLQLNGFFFIELQQDILLRIRANKQIDNIRVHLAVIEGKQQGASDCSLHSTRIDSVYFLEQESDVAGQVVGRISVLVDMFDHFVSVDSFGFL